MYNIELQIKLQVLIMVLQIDKQKFLLLKSTLLIYCNLIYFAKSEKN